ncbi:tRNA (guanine-N7)-methyltransferase [Candidatus Tenderia electrophaga]|jgi:tRNA (guanine-N7-)-methyltransferase|uniref:tRNA (guanine-N(7)-)-methyltransferase n=1 Tax=Candidatus Tenderia electrophaga TaxID=1748243 RepID=A0A0S2T949_9GAMM|nr:tRNA (guanine-N7)-methyltransferase [Candidatus Tenderia electrophaga]
MTATDNPHRPIRSFVRRQGRMTARQEWALRELWPTYGLEPGAEVLDLDAVFDRSAPKILEIGFGMGDALAEMALNHPEQDYLGIEVHRPGVGRLLDKLAAQGSSNVRIFCHDAVEVLQRQIPDNSLDKVLLFFPDPWHKKRHHKRRIVRPAYVELIRTKLKSSGVFHMATDWQEYAEWMMTVMSAAAGFGNLAGAGTYSEKPDYRPETKFERRGQRLGHGVWDLLFKKT